MDRQATFPDILTAGVMNKIVACKSFIATLVSEYDNSRNFAAEVSQYKRIYLNSRLGTASPAAPVPPAAISVPANVVVGMQAFARQLAAQLNAHGNMTDAIRAAMGISGSAPGLGSVRVVSATALGGSHVALRLRLSGHRAVAVYRMRGGVTERIGVSIRASFTDTSGPLVPGQSESRGYWVRGIVDNVEQGEISATELVATTP